MINLNMITCCEPCAYQRDGYCKMGVAAPISAVKVDGCSYFKASKKKKNMTKARLRK